MKKIGLLFFVTLLWGCGGGSDPEFQRPVVPSVEPSVLSVKEGEVAQARVLDADKVDIVENSRPDLIEADVVGLVITVKGLAAGEGVITLLADETRLTLRVTVTPLSVDERYDFTLELADSRTRFISHGLELWYDTPGVIVSRHESGLVEMRDLGSGSHIAFNPAGDAEGMLPHASLTINGVAAPLDNCTLQRRQDNGDRWYSMRRTGSETHIVLVVTDL